MFKRLGVFGLLVASAAALVVPVPAAAQSWGGGQSNYGYYSGGSRGYDNHTYDRGDRSYDRSFRDRRGWERQQRLECERRTWERNRWEAQRYRNGSGYNYYGQDRGYYGGRY